MANASKYGDYAEDVKLNRFDLIGEAEQVSEALMWYYEELADVKEIRNAAQNKVKFIRGEAFLKWAKADPAVVGLKSMTVDAIKALVETDEAVLVAEDILVKAEKEVVIYEGAVKSLSTKSDMLKECVKLWGGGYYAAKS